MVEANDIKHIPKLQGGYSRPHVPQMKGLSPLIDGLLAAFEERFEGMVSIPYPENAHFSIGLLSMLRKALMLMSGDYARESLVRLKAQKEGDFKAWFEIVAYFDADILYSYVFYNVPINELHSAINPYVRDIMLHRTHSLITLMFVRLIHPDTMYMMVRWARVREGLGAGGITYNLSRYLRQETGINWGEVGRLVKRRVSQNFLIPN